MLSMSVIAGIIASLWGSGALLGWLVRLGIMPFIPHLGKVLDLALELGSILLRGLVTQLAKQFESFWGVLILGVFFYAGAWHFADWRPWHGFSKEKAAAHRVMKTAPAAKVATKPAKRKNDAKSIFDRNFQIF